MNKNQKEFLDELAKLFDKYNIDEMYVNISGSKISFNSNSESFCFTGYDNGCFRGIVITPDDYTPRTDG